MAKVNSIQVDEMLAGLDKFGQYQTLQYVLACLPVMMVTMMSVNYIFVAEEIGYRCRIPECETENVTVDTPSWWPTTVDKCYRPQLDISRYDKNNQTCTNSTFLDVWEECQDWMYENNNSVVAEFNLGCQSWKATLVGSCHNAGMIVAMLLTGWISDKVGRKPATILCAVGGAIGVIKTLITNYYAYLGIEFLESVVASGLYTVAVVLLIEVGGESKRVLAGVIFSYASYVGEVIFAFLAMGFQYWKTIILIAYSPMVLFIFYVFILRESTRWQMLRGKMDEAKKSFKLMARMNKLNISEKEIDDVDDEVLRKRFNIQIQREKETVRNIIRSKEIMTRLAVTSVCFFTSGLLSVGLMVHSVLLPGNKYTNFALVALTSFPGDFLAYITFNKFGRRITLQAGYFSSAVFILAQSYTPNSITWLKILLFLFGKLGVVISFTGMFTYSLELFPTSVRGSLVGCANTAARVGTMLAPLTPLLSTHMETLPSVIFAATAILSGVLLLFTPETRTLPMFDTIAQVEAHRTKIETQF